MQKKIYFLLFLLTGGVVSSAQQLIIRCDDMAFAHASNVATIKCYTDGIEQSAEIIIIAPWVPEAVQLLKEHPGLDAGLHVAFSSEWEWLKWRPLTHCPSLTDENGYFLPSAVPSAGYPGKSLMERKDKININEVEAELRAQIELAQRLIPHLTHISVHMDAAKVSTEIAEVFDRISNEYGLPFVDGETEKWLKIEGIHLTWGLSPNERKRQFIETLGKLEQEKTYLYLEHPAMDGDEMRAVWHIGYENVADDRQGVVDMLTDPVVKKIIADKGIKLISYKDIINAHKSN
jgi:predicted glycoside hydrolase/deacetylase ChbG (UPF0249 family)